MCGPDEDRTRYLLYAIQALYQVSYRPKISFCEKILNSFPSLKLPFFAQGYEVARRKDIVNSKFKKIENLF